MQLFKAPDALNDLQVTCQLPAPSYLLEQMAKAIVGFIDYDCKVCVYIQSVHFSPYIRKDHKHTLNSHV